MLITEADPVDGGGYLAVRTRLLADMRGRDGIRLSPGGGVELQTGQRRLVLRRRADRSTRTFIRMRGDRWYRVTGVAPVPNSLVRDEITMRPAVAPQRLLDVVTAGGEPVTAGGERLIA